MIYGSVCSGIEAATVAWEPIGWNTAFFSEIEKFPRAVLQHHYPTTPLHGDFTTIGDEYGSIDLLVGGTPCQSFSVAGLRKGMGDDRGNLALEYLKLAQRLRPKWVVWENVPGVLSSNGGHDFFSFIAGLQELGYGFAYRVLDAQYFGVAQRRRRVFVVGCFGDWRSAAAVLFERESLQGHPAPSREARKEVAGFTSTSIGEYSPGCGTLRASGGANDYKEPQAICIGGQHPNAAICEDDLAPTLTEAMGAGGGHIPMAIQNATRGKSQNGLGISSDEIMYTLDTAGQHAVQLRQSVRRLTPIECERLQGFPDNYTRIPWRNKTADDCPDGPRYKAIGNSMAVPVMRWIGERIEMVEAVKKDSEAAS